MINIKSRISTTPSSPKETKMSEYTINYSIDGWPICKNGEPIYGNKAMLAELRQLQARIKELEEELATTRAGWQETIVKMASQERPAYDEQQQRIAKLEAINLGLTKTLVEMEEEKAKLVGALEPFAKCARELDGSPEDGIDPADDDEWAKFRLLVSDYRRARAALSAYRKGGE